ncbi:hypothetical protein [Pelagimonas sp. KU-00592-HH]|uniref:hypothetical protein n=1 Tax=Pelagimonas sp. KU-00592-HH TaxID=3127651 RepID=UPI003340A406
MNSKINGIRFEKFLMDVRSCSISELIEYAFFRAFEENSTLFSRWRAALSKLEGFKPDKSPHDAGDNDAYFDCLIRALEDEHARAASNSSKHLPSSRERFQIQVTRYWLVSMSEMLRSTYNSMVPDHPHRSDIAGLRDMFGAFRIPISKQEVHKADDTTAYPKAHIVNSASDPNNNEISCDGRVRYQVGAYRVEPLFNEENGSILFPVYDHRLKEIQTFDRRQLSEHFLTEVEKLK